MAKVLVKKGFIVIVATAGPEGYDPENVTITELKKGYLSIVAATPRLGVAYNQYVRRLVLEDKLKGIKVACRGTTKWFVDIEGIGEYLSNKGGHGGLRRYDLRLNREDEMALRAFLVKDGITFKLELAYKPKEDN